MKNGRNYTLPLFYMSPDLGRSHIKTSKQHPIFELTKEACLYGGLKREMNIVWKISLPMANQTI